MLLRKLIVALERHEKISIDIYQYFNSVFSSQTLIFGKLWEKEIYHHSLFLVMLGTMSEELLIDEDMVVGVELIEQFSHKDENYYQELQGREISIAEAFDKAIKLEEAIAESEFFLFFEARQKQQEYFSVYKVLEEKKQHKQQLLKEQQKILPLALDYRKNHWDHFLTDYDW